MVDSLHYNCNIDVSVLKPFYMVWRVTCYSIDRSSHPFFYAFIHPVIRGFFFIYSVGHYSFIHSSIYSFICSVSLLSTHSFIHSFTPSLIDSFIYSFIEAAILCLIYSLFHSLINSNIPSFHPSFVFFLSFSFLSSLLPCSPPPHVHPGCLPPVMRGHVGQTRPPVSHAT